MSDRTTTPRRSREPFEARGRFIWGGPTEHDAIVGEVYDNGQPFPEELAKVWAASYQIMFPALAEIRNASAIAAYATAEAWPVEAVSLLERIHQRARDALPVPTIGDVNGPEPEAPRRSSVQEATHDSDALKRERHLSRDLMDLLKSMFDAPTMEGGYAILSDFARQFWPEDPVALSAARAVAPQEATAAETITAAEAAARQGRLAAWWNAATRDQRLAVIDGARHLLSVLGGAPAGVPEVTGELRYFAHDASGGVTDLFATEAEAIAFAEEGVKVASEAANDDGEWEEGADQIYVGIVTHRAILQERDCGTYDLTFGPLSASPTPTAQGQDSDDTIKKRWIIIREPGCVPVTKIPKQSHDGAREFLRECAAIYPTADITLAELTWNNDLWVSDGREALTIDDAMAEYAEDTDDWTDRVPEPQTSGCEFTMSYADEPNSIVCRNGHMIDIDVFTEGFDESDFLHPCPKCNADAYAAWKAENSDEDDEADDAAPSAGEAKR